VQRIEMVREQLQRARDVRRQTRSTRCGTNRLRPSGSDTAVEALRLAHADLRRYNERRPN
jgi:hypothetical protein